MLFSRTDSAAPHGSSPRCRFGGYVKFRGDANPSAGRDDEALEHLSEAEKRTTMHGAPLWARSATVAAGPLFNFALSIVIFTAVLLFRGVVAEPLTVGELRPICP